MASPAASSSDASDRGQMQIAEQVTTFRGVMGMFKWGSLWTAAILVLLTMWFCTPAGFLPGFIVAVIMLALGTFFLRSKPKPGH